MPWRKRPDNQRTLSIKGVASGVNQVGLPCPKDVDRRRVARFARIQANTATPEFLRIQPLSDSDSFLVEIPDFFTISGKTAKLRLQGMAILEKIPRLSGSGERERIGTGSFSEPCPRQWRSLTHYDTLLFLAGALPCGGFSLPGIFLAQRTWDQLRERNGIRGRSHHPPSSEPGWLGRRDRIG